MHGLQTGVFQRAQHGKVCGKRTCVIADAGAVQTSFFVFPDFLDIAKGENRVKVSFKQDRLSGVGASRDFAEHIEMLIHDDIG